MRRQAGDPVTGERVTAAADRLVRRFARETNLLIAARPARVASAQHPALAERLERMLRACGAIVVPARQEGALDSPGVVDYLLDSAADPVACPEDVSILLDGSSLPERGDAAGRIAFARERMPATAALATRLDVAGLRVGVAMVLEPKTAVLALALHEAGAAVSVYAHPDEIDLAVADALRVAGVPVSGHPDLSGAAERAAALAFLDGPDGTGLDVVLDDGAHLIRLAHVERPRDVARWIGACEETTSGLTPLRRMAASGVLATPVMAVNDAATKTRFDNRYGTGQSCVFAVADLLEERAESVRSRPPVVVGYGPVGAGVASVLRALGAEVAVAERDPVRALEALHDGFAVARLEDVCDDALVVSATGAPSTITADVLARAAVVAVAGGVPGEIDRPAAPGTAAVVLGGGGAVNITAAEGNPIEIMDLSFAVQLAALDTLVRERPGVGIHPLPPSVDDDVARVALAGLGVVIDDHEPVAMRDAWGWESPRYPRAVAAVEHGDAAHPGAGGAS